MKDRDIEALVKALAPVVRDFVGKQIAAITERQDALEKRLSDLPHYATAKELAELASAHNKVREMVVALPPVPTAEEVAALIPAPAAGKDGRDGVDGKDGKDGKDGEKGLDGKDGAPGTDGQNGADGAPGRDGVDGKDGYPGSNGEKGDPGKDGADGKDGVGLAGALVDREGNLIVTMTDGSTKSLGVVVGKDGAPGRDGADGIGFDDLEIVDGGMDFTLRFTRGDTVKEWTLAKPTLADCYRGVWREGEHKAGDAVTWGGSLWIAKRDTDARPEANDDWQLAVKRGRDGKDGESPKPPKQVKL